MKYNLCEILDGGVDGDGVVGNTSITSTPDNTEMDGDSLPMEGRICMVMNTTNGQLIETGIVTEVYERWTSPDGSENVIFTDGKKAYYWYTQS
jgi:hypothetical protein